MTLAILITIGIIIYFIIGRALINIFQEYDLVDVDDWKGLAVFIFPAICIWILIIQVSEFLSDAFVELMSGKKRNKW